MITLGNKIEEKPLLFRCNSGSEGLVENRREKVAI